VDHRRAAAMNRRPLDLVALSLLTLLGLLALAVAL
jgi:hypothetical protein